MIRTVLHISETTTKYVRIHDWRVKQIEAISKRMNKARQLSGLLVANEQHFLHIIEGREPQVEMVLDKIQRDSRNKNFEIIFDVIWETRLFNDWKLATEYSLDHNQQVKSLLKCNVDALPMLDDDQISLLISMLNIKRH